jgi:hypothetical protein
MVESDVVQSPMFLKKQSSSRRKTVICIFVSCVLTKKSLGLTFKKDIYKTLVNDPDSGAKTRPETRYGPSNLTTLEQTSRPLDLK